MLRLVAKVLKALASEQAPAQLALAFALAMVAGITPLASPHNLVVLLLALTLRVNLSIFLVGLALFSAVGLALAPLFHQIGLALLTAPALHPAWVALYNTVPVRRYREHLLAWVRKSRLAQLLKASKLWRAYQAVSRVRGGGS